MQKKLSYPRRPVWAAWLTFLGCSAWVTIFLPFVMDELPPKTWLLLYAYCALLAVASIGLVRLSRLALLPLVLAIVIAIIPGAVGVKLLVSLNSMDAGMIWLRVSLYLFYAVGVLAFFFVIKGWSLYFIKPHDEPST